MTPDRRHLRRTHVPALLLFAVVYLAALVLVVSPVSLRAVAPCATQTGSLFPLSQGDP